MVLGLVVLLVTDASRKAEADKKDSCFAAVSLDRKKLAAKAQQEYFEDLGDMQAGRQASKQRLGSVVKSRTYQAVDSVATKRREIRHSRAPRW